MAKRQAHKTEVKRTWETSNGDRIHVELLDGRTGSGWKNPRRVHGATIYCSE